MSTSQETIPVYSNPYYIYNWVEGDFVGTNAGDPVIVTGGGFLPGSLLTLSDVGSVSGSGTVAPDGTISILGSATGLTTDMLASDESGRTATKAFSPPAGTLSPATVTPTNPLV